MLIEGSPPPPVMCHVSHITSHVSLVKCQMLYFLLNKVMKLVGGGYVINRATLSSLLIDSSFSSHSCCFYDQVAEVEQVSPLSLKMCVSAWKLWTLNCAH